MLPQEADSRPALLHEMRSGQGLSHEADSGHLYELSGRMAVGHDDVPEVDSRHLHELSGPMMARHIGVPEANPGTSLQQSLRPVEPSRRRP